MAKEGNRRCVKDFLLHAVGQYTIRAYNQGLVRNTLVSLTEMPSTANKQAYIFGGKGGKDVAVAEKRVHEHSFRFPYAATGCSTQGMTLEERYCIHGGGNNNVKWWWTALTRCVSLKNVFIGTSRESDPTQKNFEHYTAAKLSTYVDSDKKANRFDASSGAYDLKKMTDMCMEAYMKKCSGLCGEGCDNVMDLNDREEAISFDRIDSKKGHSWSNLRCVCLSCNRHAQARDGGF